MQMIGKIIKLKGASAIVTTERPASCKTCSNASICGKRKLKIIASNKIHAKVGDTVTVDVKNDSKALAVIAYVFLVPVIIFFVGCGLYMVNPYATIICLPLLVAYFYILKSINSRFKTNSEIIGVTHTIVEPSCYQGEKE